MRARKEFQVRLGTPHIDDRSVVLNSACFYRRGEIMLRIIAIEVKTEGGVLGIEVLENGSQTLRDVRHKRSNVKSTLKQTYRVFKKDR